MAPKILCKTLSKSHSSETSIGRQTDMTRSELHLCVSNFEFRNLPSDRLRGGGGVFLSQPCCSPCIPYQCSPVLMCMPPMGLPTQPPSIQPPPNQYPLPNPLAPPGAHDMENRMGGTGFLNPQTFENLKNRLVSEAKALHDYVKATIEGKTDTIKALLEGGNLIKQQILGCIVQAQKIKDQIQASASQEIKALLSENYTRIVDIMTDLYKKLSDEEKKVINLNRQVLAEDVVPDVRPGGQGLPPVLPAARLSRSPQRPISPILAAAPRFHSTPQHLPSILPPASFESPLRPGTHQLPSSNQLVAVAPNGPPGQEMSLAEATPSHIRSPIPPPAPTRPPSPARPASPQRPGSPTRPPSPARPASPQRPGSPARPPLTRPAPLQIPTSATRPGVPTFLDVQALAVPSTSQVAKHTPKNPPPLSASIDQPTDEIFPPPGSPLMASSPVPRQNWLLDTQNFNISENVDQPLSQPQKIAYDMFRRSFNRAKELERLLWNPNAPKLEDAEREKLVHSYAEHRRNIPQHRATYNRNTKHSLDANLANNLGHKMDKKRRFSLETYDWDKEEKEKKQMVAKLGDYFGQRRAQLKEQGKI